MISSAVDDGLAQRAVLRARSGDGACRPDGLRSDGLAAVPTDRVRDRLPERRSPGLSAEIIDHSEGFRSLKNDWNALFDDAATGTQVFLSFAMCWNWYLAFNSEETRSRRSFKLRILAVRDNGRLVVVCPLAEDRWLGLNRLSWFGSPVSQYGDILVARGPQRDAYVKFAGDFLRDRSGADVLKLWKVREDAVTRTLMSGLDGSMICSDTALSVNLGAVSSWSQYEARFSSKVRKNRRRQRRRLEERGDVRFQVVGQGEDAAQCCIEALEMKRRWLSARGRVSRGLANPGTSKFFQAVSKDRDDAAGTRVFRLSCGDETAALAVGFMAKDRLVVHILVYNLEMASTGAGALILEDIMKWCFENGVAVCDLMAPGDDYKLEWCRDATQVSDWVVPLTPRGRFYQRIGMFHASRVIKSAVSWLPYRLRRTLAHAYGLMVPFIV